jgi:hypothetical protein
VSETVSNKYPLFQAFNEYVNAIDIVEQADCGSFAESLALLEMLRGNTAAAKELLTDYRSWDRRVPEPVPEPEPMPEPEPAPEPIEEPPASATPGFQTDMFGSTPRPLTLAERIRSRTTGQDKAQASEEAETPPEWMQHLGSIISPPGSWPASRPRLEEEGFAAVTSEADLIPRMTYLVITPDGATRDIPGEYAAAVLADPRGHMILDA